MTTIEEFIIGLKPITLALTVIIMIYLIFKKGSMTRGRSPTIVWWFLVIFMAMVAVTLGFDLFILGEG